MDALVALSDLYGLAARRETGGRTLCVSTRGYTRTEVLGALRAVAASVGCTLRELPLPAAAAPDELRMAVQ